MFNRYKNHVMMYLLRNIVNPPICSEAERGINQTIRGKLRHFVGGVTVSQMWP